MARRSQSNEAARSSVHDGSFGLSQARCLNRARLGRVSAVSVATSCISIFTRCIQVHRKRRVFARSDEI